MVAKKAKVAKRGGFSVKEQKFIFDNWNKVAVEKIASTLNRTETSVRKYIEKLEREAGNKEIMQRLSLLEQRVSSLTADKQNPAVPLSIPPEAKESMLKNMRIKDATVMTPEFSQLTIPTDYKKGRYNKNIFRPRAN